MLFCIRKVSLQLLHAYAYELKKILKQVEYESARRKKCVNEKTRYREEQVATLLFFTFISLKLKGTQENSKELKGTHLNSFEPKELKGTQRNSRELKGTQGNSSELI